MRSVEYAKGVIRGIRNAPESIKDNAKEYITIINRHDTGEIQHCGGIATIQEAISYEQKYLNKDLPWNDALVFAIMYGLIKGKTLYYVPRKNGKTTYLYHVMKFVHIYKNHTKVGICGCSDFAYYTMSRFRDQMFFDGYKCATKGNSLWIRGKENEYVLLSESNPANDNRVVDILLVDEVLALEKDIFKSIDVTQDILATSSLFVSKRRLGLRWLDNQQTFDNVIDYSTKNKNITEIKWSDIVQANPILESELFNKREDNINTRLWKNQYNKSIHMPNIQKDFLIKYLNMPV